MQIQQLAEGPIAALDTVRQEWLAHGISTEPADRAESERGVVDAYRAAGLEPPRRIIWLDSPMAGAIATWLLATRRIRKDRAGARVWNRFWDQIQVQLRAQMDIRFRPHAWDQVRNQVRDQVRHEVWARVRTHLWEQAETHVRAQITGRVGNHAWGRIRQQIEDRVRTDVQAPIQAQVQAEIRDQIQAQMEDQFHVQIGAQDWRRLRAPVLNAVAGQHEAAWLAYYDFFGTQCTLAEVDRLAALMRVARSSGWWWPHRTLAIITERPTALHRDAQGRLHSPNGPALAYPDEFAIWAWHGVRVPRNLIEEGWNTLAIMRQPDPQVRRCAIERMGWDRFIEDAGLTPIASCPDPGNPPHRLELYDLPKTLAPLYGYGTKVRILLCVNDTADPNGTRGLSGVPVPAHHTNPAIAAAEIRRAVIRPDTFT
ncbi:DUF6745 domain-containing protein [Nonomuraea sp. NPDC003201]